eukprot:jgi/Tetstr1/421550/TSEL_012496.t1
MCSRAERTVQSYGSEFNLFCEFCAQTGRLPDTADPPLIVRYISWVAARGRNKAGAFGPYLSAINAFFTDNFKEPPALGPFVNQAMRGWELAQQVLDAPDYREENTGSLGISAAPAGRGATGTRSTEKHSAPF